MKERLRAPAKINLFLQVLEPLPNGYHEIYTLFQKVTLFDELEIELVDTPGIKLQVTGGEVPEGETNLAFKAAQALLDELGSNKGVRIHLRKVIPVAAGLGGGSSDAAAVLKGVNKLLGAPLSQEELAHLGRPLGADIPFFVWSYGAALGEGIGDILTPWPVHKAFYVLFTPPYGVSTATVYKKLRLTRRKEPFIYDPGQPPWLRGLVNDLEKVTLALHPDLEEVKAAFIAFGALATLMSGSGPTIFGVFDQYQRATQAARALASRFSGRVHVVRPCGMEDKG